MATLKTLILLALASLILLTGCVTGRVLGAINSNKTVEVDALAIAADGSKFAALTKNYDFVFENSQDLTKSLRGALHPYMTADISSFWVNQEGQATGSVTLNLKDLPSDLIPIAKAAGFESASDSSMRKRFNLQGRVYKVSDNARAANLKLNQKYRVDVDFPESSTVKALRLLVTPITLAADGLLFFSGAPGLLIEGALAPKSL